MMAVYTHNTTVTGDDRQTSREDETDGEPSVPPVLRQLIERASSEGTYPQPLDVFQPTDWPSCPACDDRLLPAAVATDTHDTLVAAAMRCYNSDHGLRQYVYNVGTDTLYFDQVLTKPATDTPDG